MAIVTKPMYIRYFFDNYNFLQEKIITSAAVPGQLKVNATVIPCSCELYVNTHVEHMDVEVTKLY